MGVGGPSGTPPWGLETCFQSSLSRCTANVCRQAPQGLRAQGWRVHGSGQGQLVAAGWVAELSSVLSRRNDK